MVCGVVSCACGDWLEGELFACGYAHGVVVAFTVGKWCEIVHEHPSITKGY